MLLLQGIKPLIKQLPSEAHHLCQWNYVSNTSAKATGNWGSLSPYQCLWITFGKWAELLNCHSEGFKSTLKISNTNHQGYAAEIMVPDHFNLQCMLIHNEPIPAWTLINTGATDDAFIDSFFICKYWFFINLIHTSLDLKAFNGQDTDHIIYTVTLLMFILEEPI